MTHPPLSQKNLELLTYLHRFRFLTSHQLMTLLNHKNIRNTNYYLNRLASLNFTGSHYSRALGQANSPAAHFLSASSVRVLSDLNQFDHRSLRRIYRERLRSNAFITRSLFLADYYLALKNDSQKQKATLHFLTQTDLLKHPFVLRPLPSAYYARVDKKGQVKRYFIEVIDDSTPRFVLRKRLGQYSDYIDTGEFEAATGYCFPTLLLICPSLAHLIYLHKHISRVYDDLSFDQTKVFLSTRENALKGIWESVDQDYD